MLILLETMAEERRTATAPELLEPLMARLAGGDQEALAELYHRTRTSVYGLALSYLKNQHDAEDVTQDAFVRAWENAHQYRPQGTPLAWLLTIARNLALMKLRERGQDPGHGSGGLGTAGSGEPDGDGGGPAGAGRRPHRAGG